MKPTHLRLCRACAAAAAAGLLIAPAAAGSASGASVPRSSTPVTTTATTAATAPTPSSTPSPETGTGFTPLTPAVAAQLDAAVRQVMREAQVPGVTVGLWAPGKGSYVRSFGVADKATGAPMTPSLHVRIGSETKTFTVTALLQLVDQGKVRLDDHIGDYVAGVPNGDRITLRELAGMRSGLFNYSLDGDFIKNLQADPERYVAPRQLLDYSFKHPVQFEPGAEFDYSNTNLILLGLVVEKITGRPLHEVITKDVLGPAGLRSTVFPTSPALPVPYAHGYTDQTATGKTEDATRWNPSWAWAAGEMASDLQDLRSWARTLATGTLLKPATQAERLKTTPMDIPGAGYGLGIFDVQGWIGHNGSIPGYEVLPVYLPSAQATMVILLNTDSQYKGQEPSTLFGEAVTSIVTPDHVYPGHKPVVPRTG
ncbi:MULTISPECIES: serine hydrolase domain-containing protein [Streptomyces]|uniref:Beta-lactamase n=1 Tax=Streptomyces spororaveus TaxID=284039 RepID=A0ABQ3T419_9ACTN|nr:MULTISPECIES: serine hydrolase domain-containing protein [Streptomyces]MCM9077040.1 beta-lactamase family protein [Streptomyces spororaveus]MCX5308306.1 beta-lactamase family protein [Streptomyces sp. NBC_00160]GHI75131.1 beta-lactamase [Streptomyces spororaveus]